jgi:hypothetical protein
VATPAEKVWPAGVALLLPVAGLANSPADGQLVSVIVQARPGALVVEADTAGEARAAAASERGWPLTETVSSLATEPPAAMPVSRPGRPAYSTDFCTSSSPSPARKTAESRSRRAGPG